MSRVDQLKDAKSSDSVKFKEFMRIVANNKRPVFFEGEDEKYYTIRVNNYYRGIDWVGVNAKGKTNVLALREKIKKHPRYKDINSMFFVDADFDDNSKLAAYEDVYVTPCYSVENFYFSEKVFISILSAEFGVSEFNEDSECYRTVLDLYRETVSQYIEAIKPFNCLVYNLKNKKKEGAFSGGLNLSDIKFESLVDVNIGSVTKVYDEFNPQSIFNKLNGYEIDPADHNADFLQQDSNGMKLRGKQNLEFFRRFIEKLKNDRNSREPARVFFSRRSTVRITLTKDNILSDISQYADTPQCLQDFLAKFSSYKLAA
ncbi:DUF4435 domain-containing protein [Cobetia sp. MB87]|uniref:DUF4435 domain-containing protein n=1 Tax=Cobetia sp. MB87 TaxID=2588451 RepID=UPI001407CF0D|nr:DUF4435 domain-containing protein [Cobetia sp. MB87]NHH85879.1 hypothetical protein [Cobetia sp. MB87]